MTVLRYIGRGFANVITAVVALVVIGAVVSIAANYALTQGSGTTFGSVVVGGVNYAQHLLCDLTTPSQCAAVSNTGQVSVAINGGSAINANGIQNSANSSPVVLANDQVCTNPTHAFKHITSATDTLAVQGVTAQTVRLCAWKSRAAGTATWFWENTASTNANCGSTLTQIGGVATEAANTGEVVALPIGVTLNNTSGNGLCINSTGTGGFDLDYWYQQR